MSDLYSMMNVFNDMGIDYELKEFRGYAIEINDKHKHTQFKRRGKVKFNLDKKEKLYGSHCRNIMFTNC